MKESRRGEAGGLWNTHGGVELLYWYDEIHDPEIILPFDRTFDDFRFAEISRRANQSHIRIPNPRYRCHGDRFARLV